MQAHPDWESWLANLWDGEPPSAVVETILSWVRNQTQAEIAFLLLPDPSGWWVDFAYVVGTRAEQLQGLRLRPEETLLERTLTESLPWHYQQPRPQASERISLMKSGEGVFSGCAIPLPGLSGSALGVLNTPTAQDKDTLSLLYSLAPILSLLVMVEQLHTEQTHSAQVLSWLAELPSLLGDEVSLQNSLQAIGTLLRSFAPLGGGVWLYDESRTALVCAHRYGMQFFEDTVSENQLPPHWQEEPCEFTVRERLYRLYPLRGRNRVWGFIGIALPLENPLLIEYVPKLIPQFALLIAQAMLYEQTARRAQHMTTLFHFSLKLGEVHTPPEVLNLMALTAREIVPHDFAVVYFPDPKSNDLLMPLLVMPEHPALWNHFPPVRNSLPGWVYEFNAPLACRDLANDPRHQKAPLPNGFASALTVPLQVAERPLGVLVLLTTSPRDFTLLEVELLFTLANAGALRLHALEYASYA